jgi:ceramide glucosyltransferase
MIPFISVVLALGSLAYLAFSIVRVIGFKRYKVEIPVHLPPVTVLKPLCGLDAELYENLRSFCEQDYPEYEVIFGTTDAADPAIPVVQRLIRECRGRNLSLVVDERIIGSNRKVSNLANIYATARHDLLVIADSDMRVGPDYLRSIAGCFADVETGAATCLYTGAPSDNRLPSILGSSFINEWFLPSVLVASAFQEIRCCFGATMAVRRDVLKRIGGFPVLASMLADDYMLGKLVSDLGHKVIVAPYLVENVVLEKDLKSLYLHELRWARTVRSVEPLGYSLSLVTHALPMTLLFLGVGGAPTLGVAMVIMALSLRVSMQYLARRSLGARIPFRPWLVPLRDLFSFVVWCTSFFGNDVRWRQFDFSHDGYGNMQAIKPMDEL